jgi:site-specific recombinase XerD
LSHCPLNPTTLLRALKLAAASAKIDKPVKVHTLRHCYATHLLEAGVDIRAIQSFLGHSHVNTTMIYTHLTEQSQLNVRTLIDLLMAEL